MEFFFFRQPDTRFAHFQIKHFVLLGNNPIFAIGLEEDKMTEQSLKEKTAKGLFWGGLSNGLQQLLNLFFGIFLARLLTQEDYGMVGVLSIFSLIASTLQESGFISALANRKEIKHEDYNAVFWFSSLAGLSMYLILFACAPLIAHFFHTPELTSLARYSFLGFLISSTGVAHSAYLFRTLQVKQRAMASVIGLLLSGTIGITLAYLGFSYWGIATQSLVYIATTTSCYWYFSSWRPSFKLDFSPLKQMFSFSSKILITNTFHHIHNNIFSLILGKFYAISDVGNYNQANKWNYMGHSFVNGMVSNVAQPVLAQVADDKERQLRVFRRMMRFTCFVSFPAMFGLSFVAPELITIAITDKWIASAQILQILSIGGAFIPIINLCINLLISKGKSNIYMWNTIILVFIQAIIAILLYPKGIYTLVYIYVTINIAWLLVWNYFVNKEIGYRTTDLLKDILPYLFITLGTMAVTSFATSNCTHIYMRFIAKIGMASSVYVLIMWLSGSVTFKESLNYILRKKTSNGQITLIPVGGLANRMKAIDAAVALAEESGSQLQILWFKDKGLNCRFDQLFKPLQCKNVILKEATWMDMLIYDRPRKKNFHIPRLFQKMLFDTCIYEEQATQLFYKNFDFQTWVQRKNAYIASCVYFYPQHTHPLFSIFQPTAHVQKQIENTSKRFNKKTIGIHIRRTDNIASITQSPTELFIERMEQEIKIDTNCLFYLATDSEDEKKRLKEAFGERIITSPRMADRNSIRGMQDALAELYILSNTTKIFGSMKSSYSETAAQISNIRCELLKQKT